MERDRKIPYKIPTKNLTEIYTKDSKVTSIYTETFDKESDTWYSHTQSLTVTTVRCEHLFIYYFPIYEKRNLVLLLQQVNKSYLRDSKK